MVLSGDTDQCLQGKLLSARMIEDGTGSSQADEVVASLDDWKARDNVNAMCFDTTSANTVSEKVECKAVIDFHKSLIFRAGREELQ